MDEETWSEGHHSRRKNIAQVLYTKSWWVGRQSLWRCMAMIRHCAFDLWRCWAEETGPRAKMTDCTSHPEALSHEATLSWGFVPAVSRQIPQPQVAHSNVKAQPQAALSLTAFGPGTQWSSALGCVSDSVVTRQHLTHTKALALCRLSHKILGNLQEDFLWLSSRARQRSREEVLVPTLLF